MSPNSGAALDAVLQQEDLSDQLDAVLQQEELSDHQQLLMADPPVVSAACDGAAEILTTAGRGHVVGRTDDTMIVSTPPSVVQGKKKYRISPHPLKGTKKFDDNVHNHYTEILSKSN